MEAELNFKGKAILDICGLMDLHDLTLKDIEDFCRYYKSREESTQQTEKVSEE